MKLYYYLYRKFKHIPCRQEIRGVIKSGTYLSPVIRDVAITYADDYSLDVVACVYRITRERARQYLLKAARGSKPLESSFICFSYSINDVGGKPQGFIWLTACFTDKNYRLFPIGYRK
jgi:hypothetical protein